MNKKLIAGVIILLICLLFIGYVISQNFNFIAGGEPEVKKFISSPIPSPQAENTYYYVAKDGDDRNPGTETEPWLTIQKSADTLNAGDTVYIKEGIYNERVLPKNSGSPENYITYIAYSDQAVTIDGTGIKLDGVFDAKEKSYIKISGLKIVNSTYTGIFVKNSSHIIIEKNYTYNTWSSGITVQDSEDIIIDGNSIELACNDGWGECLTVANTKSFEVKNNRVFNGGPGIKGGEGIDIVNGSSNGKVYKNELYNLNRVALYVDAFKKHTYNIDVFQNIIHNSNSTAFALATELGGLLENVKVYNNIAYNNKGAGLVISTWGDASLPKHPMKDIKIINNTFYNNGYKWGGGILIENPDAENVVIRNNIVSQNKPFQILIKRGVPATNFTVENNLIDGFRNYPGEIYGIDAVIESPKFINPSKGDFHLQINSPAIDKGSSIDAPDNDFDNNPRPKGEQYDIGAYEK